MEERRDPPEPLPSSVRLLPPRLPPAPPGTGGPPGPGRPYEPPPPDPNNPWWRPLEESLNDLAVIRTTFETMDVFRDDPELRQEMTGIIEEARKNLAERIRATGVYLSPRQPGVDLALFQDTMMDLIERGRPGSWLGTWTNADAFERLPGEGVDPLPHRYQLRSPYDLELLRYLAPWEFPSHLLADLGAAVEDPGNYTDTTAFDRNVHGKYAALLFACYASSDPKHYLPRRQDP